MGKKILVAGGGHGGIACGAILAKNGYDVTVYEKNKRKDMGYDWTDIFDINGFAVAGMELPDEEKWEHAHNMTFLSPAMTKKLYQKTDSNQISMERRWIYDHIIKHAKDCGVKFEYGNEVLEPVMLGNRVVGIRTEKGIKYGDLVIDACGMNSNVRKQLPGHLGVQNEVNDFETFYVWRGFYERKENVESDDTYKVFLFYKGELGICWLIDEGKYCDILIGRFEPFGEDEVEETLKNMREDNAYLGEKLVRGGEFVKIPVRHTLGIMVADGYAAIGDSAFMTVPVIGSGIANSMKAAKMLADVIIDDKTDSYSARVLWKYQREYFSKIGAGLAPLAAVKLLLTSFSPDEIDHMFEKGVLTDSDMTAIVMDTTGFGAVLQSMLNPNNLKGRVEGLMDRSSALKKIARLGKSAAAVTAITTAMPKEYEYSRVHSWAEKYNACFKR